MVAKDKKKGGRQGIVSKILNLSLILLAFSQPIKVLWSNRGNLGVGVTQIIREATFGLAEGKLDLKGGLRMYTPVGASVALGTLKSYLMRKFPIRR